MPKCSATSGPRSGLPFYLATAFCARVADEGMSVAVALLALQRAGSAAQGAFILTAWMAPHAVAAPLVGALVTRARRPRLCYLGALSGFAAAVASLSLLVGRAPAPVTLAVALAGGACGPVVTGGLSSLIATLVPHGRAAGPCVRARCGGLQRGVGGRSRGRRCGGRSGVPRRRDDGPRWRGGHSGGVGRRSAVRARGTGRRRPLTGHDSGHHPPRRPGSGTDGRLAHPRAARDHRRRPVWRSAVSAA